MKRFLFTISLLILCCGAAFGANTSYYVTQNGAGGFTGLSLANAWRVSDFNSSANWSATDDANKIDPGDTVYFSGTITTAPIVPTGVGGSSGGGYVTLDGYEAGDCDHIPTVDINAAQFSPSSGYGLRFMPNTSYIIVQDIRIQNISEAGIRGYTSAAGQTIHHITIRRCAVEHLSDGNDGIHFNPGSGSYGNVISYITIQDSLLHDISPASQDSATGLIRLYRTDDVIIQRNYIYNDPGDPLVGNGVDGIVALSSNRYLIEYNTMKHFGENSIDWKDDDDVVFGDIIIRFNYFGDSIESAVALQDVYGHHAYFYCNWIDGSVGDGILTNGLFIYRGFENVYAWSNIVTDVDKGGLSMYDVDPTRPVDNGVFYNNTVVHNRILSTSKEHGGIELRDRVNGTYLVKNNILVDNAINNSDYYQIFTGATAGPFTTADYNLYWTTANSPKVYWDNANIYTLSDPVSGTSFYTTEGQGEHSKVLDPLFTDYAPAGNRDLTLTSGSPAINAGVDLTGSFAVVIQNNTETLNYNIALDPNGTDWTTIPPTIVTVVRGSPGLGAWDLGAYEYGTSTGDTDPPTPNPATFSTSPTADSTSAISMVATTGTDANTISIQFDFDPAADNCGSSPNIGTGGSDRAWTAEDYTHTDDTLQTNQLYCYNAKLRDSIPNTGTASSTVSVYTLAAVPGASMLSAGSDPTTQFSFDALAENGNPTATPNTEFACQVTTVDPDWSNKWINTTGGVASASEVWSANSVWDALGDVSGLNPGTLYNVYCKARNGDNIETALGAVAQITTTGGFENPPTVTYTGIKKSGTNKQ